MKKLTKIFVKIRNIALLCLLAPPMFFVFSGYLTIICLKLVHDMILSKLGVEVEPWIQLDG